MENKNERLSTHYVLATVVWICMCEEVVAQIFSEMFNTKRLVANKIELSQLNVIHGVKSRTKT